MKRTSTIVIAVMLAGAGTLQAQDAANPISTTMKGSWTNIRDLLVKMAEKMPEENYRFKATPELQDFGQRMAHAIAFIMRGCATVQGEQKTVNVSQAGTPSKAEILAAFKEANAECDAVFNTLTDAALLKPIAGGRGAPRPAYAVLSGTVLEHSQEMYGYMAVYLRGKGIVPPSSDRNEK
jgi:DinB family protein